MNVPFRDLPVTPRHDVYPTISPEPHFESTSFRGKVVLIAGASKGIGESIASFYSRAGAKLGIVSRSQQALNETRERLLSGSWPRTGEPEVLALEADVTDAKAIEAAVKAVVQKYGRLDIVVANAGVTGPWDKVFTENEPSDWWKVMEVNLRGVFNVAHHALPYLEESSGYLVAVSSMASQINIPFGSAYSVSKVALNRFIEYAAIEHPKVKSFSLHPGSIKTDMSMQHPEWEPYMVDTLQLPAATVLSLTDGSGKFDWLSGRFVSANWDLGEVERDWKKVILDKGLLATRFTLE